MKKPKESIKLEWDAHLKNAPRDSDAWAATDRGWLFASIVPAPLAINVTGTTYINVGHYLDYEHDDRRGDGKTVHVVSSITRESTHVSTPEEARAWLEAECAGVVARAFGDMHTGYEHRREEIRRMPISGEITFRNVTARKVG